MLRIDFLAILVATVASVLEGALVTMPRMSLSQLGSKAVVMGAVAQATHAMDGFVRVGD